MTISRIDKGAIKYIADDGPRLGFPTGISTRRFSSADTVSIRNTPGIIISGSGETRSWPIERFIEHEGNMVALGPWPGNTRPFEAEAVGPEMISRMLPAIRALRSSGFPLSGLYSTAVRWLDDGGVLIFPPKLAAWMSELNHDSEKWIHPDWKAEPAWSFSLGVLAWETLTGTDPFAGESEEARRERIRKGILPPLEVYVPGVDKDAENFIRKALIGPDESAPGLEDWEDFIDLWRGKGITRALPETEIQEHRERAIREKLKIEKNLAARRWIRESGWKLITALAVAAAILIFVSAPLKKALKAPVTAGMSPVEVAETYYEAIDAMDSETMEECLSKKTDRGDVRLVTTVYVTTKMRQGYEHIEMPPVASEWIKAGKPDLPDGVWPWGVSDLVLTELNDGRIKARYLFWMPPEGGTENPADSCSVSRTDILSFIQGRRSWEISRIERAKED